MKLKLKNAVKQLEFVEVKQSQVKVVLNPQAKRDEALLSAQGLATDIALIFSGNQVYKTSPLWPCTAGNQSQNSQMLRVPG